jgi:DNA-binding NarL/FixJ family response regulator
MMNSAKKFTSVKLPKEAASTRPVQLFLVIENRLLREAMSVIFQRQSGLRLLNSIRYSETAFDQAANSGCDILLADQASTAAFPQNFITDLLSLSPGRKAIFIGMDEDSDGFLQAVRAGVSGYLLGDASAEDTVAAVRKVAMGEAVCPPKLCQHLFQFVAQSTREGSMILNQRLCLSLGLTGRQQQLIALLARGFTNKEIAESMHLSQFTVKNHVHRIMRRLKAQNRYAAVQTVCQSSIPASL